MSTAAADAKEALVDTFGRRKGKHPAKDGRKHATRATSPAVAAQAEKRAVIKPVIVKGISPGELVTITPSMFKYLDVDPAYQRGETLMVNKIIRVLQAGGEVLDPVTLCKRKDTGEKLWIVDGHQRTCAFQEVGVSFKAMLHKSESAEAEHQLFLALNARKGVHPNVIVKAWTGPSAALIMKANETMEHPLYDRVNFQQSTSPRQLDASVLAMCLNFAMGNSRRSGGIQEHLSRADLALGGQHSMNRARAEFFLRLVGKVVPKGKPPAMFLRGLGEVASERWAKEVYMPPSKVLIKLSEKNWAAEVPMLHKYNTILLEQIRKIWKEPK